MLRGSAQSQERALTVIGTAVLLAAVVAVLLAVFNPFGSGPRDRISVAIETPYVGQGVGIGSAVVMHGVKIGEVKDVKFLRGGGAQLLMSLEQRPIVGLTDALSIDFRAINYFGVSGVNVTANAGGEKLRDGNNIRLAPKGNYTLSTLLSRLGDVSAGALTPRLISVIDRATRYTDALNPMLETMVTVTTAVADVQRVSTARLLANSSSASNAFPLASRDVLQVAERFSSINALSGPSEHAAESSGPMTRPPYLLGSIEKDFYADSPDYIEHTFKRFMYIAKNGLFSPVGKLLQSHASELFPLVDGLRSITDTVPSLIRPDKFAQTIAELRSRFENLYAGSAEQRALRVRIVLDRLPGVAAPLGVLSAPATGVSADAGPADNSTVTHPGEGGR